MIKIISNMLIIAIKNIKMYLSNLNLPLKKMQFDLSFSLKKRD